MSVDEHEEREPVRLSHAASGADPALRVALDAGRAELPSDAQLAHLAARLAPLAGAAASAATLSVWPIVASVAVLVAIGAAVAYVAVTPEVTTPPAREAATRVDAGTAVDAAIDAETAAVIEPAVDAGTALAPREASVHVPHRTLTDAGVAPAPEVDVDAELALLRSAQDALRVDPARALSIASEHARRFGDGTLAQEREVVAIEALVALARMPDARARAARFAVRWPRSAHARRLAVVLGDASP